MNKKLWTRNFTLLNIASAIGAIGGVASYFALQFLVFEETQSTLATCLVMASGILPSLFVQIVVSPIMDRMSRKWFLVFGDVCNGIIYLVLGIYLLKNEFSYIPYLLIHMVLSALSNIDHLAYQSMYPNLITDGLDEKGYAISSILYPTINMIMIPIAGALYDKVGVPFILIFESFCAFVAAIIESNINYKESHIKVEKITLKTQITDLKEAVKYIKKDKGLLSIYSYVVIGNGFVYATVDLIIAFFSTTAGFNVGMYSAFSVCEFIGRTIGGIFNYTISVKKEYRFAFIVFVYTFYTLTDSVLLFLPYIGMIICRVIGGFLGCNSATLREAALQKYYPDEMRSRINALTILCTDVFSSLGAIVIGYFGDILPYDICHGIFSAIPLLAIIILLINKEDVKRIYNR